MIKSMKFFYRILYSNARYIIEISIIYSIYIWNEFFIIFNFLETSLLTKVNEWYRLHCTSWLSTHWYTYIYFLYLFYMLRSPSLELSFIVPIVSSHVSIVCCLLYPIILHWMELDNRLSGRLQNNNDHDMRE